MRSRFWLLGLITYCLTACSDDGQPTPPQGSSLEPTADVVLEGVLTYDRIHVPRGVHLRAGAPLELHARTELSVEGAIDCADHSVLLESDGALEFTGGTAASRVARSGSFTLRARGPLVLSGARITSDGAIVIDGQSTRDELRVSGSEILSGRTLTLTSSGGLRFDGDVTLASGDGEAGADRAIEAATPVVAEAGNGGDGGDVALTAADSVRVDGNLQVRLGSGGKGGDATARATAASAESAAPSAEARAGDGGASGLLRITAAGVVGAGTFECAPGAGGDGGQAMAFGADGEAGDHVAGQDGGGATAIGGDGGASRLFASDLPFPTRVRPTTDRVVGGEGGAAHARAGNGSNARDFRLVGPAGGAMTARGGSGGSSEVRDREGSLLGKGGNGGAAYFSGGNGGDGYGTCNPPSDSPSSGGRGGDASGGDGAPGVGAVAGAPGGVHLDGAGNGGNGGFGQWVMSGGMPGSIAVQNFGTVYFGAPSFQAGREHAPCPGELGACCLASTGQCVITARANCETLFGDRFFPDQDCAPIDCSYEPCCLPDDSCTLMPGDSCIARGGTPSENWWETCESGHCASLGACCFGGYCHLTPEYECTASGGVWLGTDSSCLNGRCPEPIGACCLGTGECRVLSEAQCAGMPEAVFHGDVPNCESIACPPAVGACCYLDGACRRLSQAECIGDYLGDLTHCESSDCGPNPSGSYAASITVRSDPANHEPELRLSDVRALQVSVTGNTVRVEAPEPWVNLITRADADGRLHAEARGTINGQADVRLELVARIDRASRPPTLIGQLTAGDEPSPGGLPGGGVIYDLAASAK